MKMFRNILPVLLAALFAGALSYSLAQGQTVIGTRIQINTQTATTYTFNCSPPDAGKLVQFATTSAVAVTLPQSGTSCFATGWFAYVSDASSGVVTITPTTSTIGNASTAVLGNGTTYEVISDGTNYEIIK